MEAYRLASGGEARHHQTESLASLENESRALAETENLALVEVADKVEEMAVIGVAEGGGDGSRPYRRDTNQGTLLDECLIIERASDRHSPLLEVPYNSSRTKYVCAVRALYYRVRADECEFQNKGSLPTPFIGCKSTAMT
jgi:hypothetical protein